MKVAFLDRDGVVNINYGYVGNKEKFEFKKGIFELLKFLQNKGYKLFVVTNQSGIARGFYSEADFHSLMNYMINELKKRDIEIIDYQFCPHHPEITGECECRKPKPGMILNLVKKYNIDLKKSIMIGDSLSDIKASKNAGITRSYLLEESLFDIIKKIQKDENEI